MIIILTINRCLKALAIVWSRLWERIALRSDIKCTWKAYGPVQGARSSDAALRVWLLNCTLFFFRWIGYWPLLILDPLMKKKTSHKVS